MDYGRVVDNITGRNKVAEEAEEDTNIFCPSCSDILKVNKDNESYDCIRCDMNFNLRVSKLKNKRKSLIQAIANISFDDLNDRRDVQMALEEAIGIAQLALDCEEEERAFLIKVSSIDKDSYEDHKDIYDELGSLAEEAKKILND